MVTVMPCNVDGCDGIVGNGSHLFRRDIQSETMLHIEFGII